MGMYTEFHFNARLKENVPKEVIDTLQYMVDGKENRFRAGGFDNGHPLFLTLRWRNMLNSDSYCFEADTHSTLRWDDISKAWYLCIRCNLKNYEHEIENFVDWVTPYLDAQEGDFLGFSRYEEFQEPKLIHARFWGPNE